jgi:hypothetical protein
VTKVPNGALRYKPDLSADEIRALYQKYGIPEPAGDRPQNAKAQTTPGGKSAEGSATKYDTQVVWKLLPDKSLEPIRIRTGITDHTFTEMIQLLNGELKAGDDLVTGVAQSRASGGAPKMGGPSAPRGR